MKPSRRPLIALAALTLVLALAWGAGAIPSSARLRIMARRFLQPPSRAEMDRAAAGDSVRAARARRAPAFRPMDPPVTVGQMLLWFALPVAGTVLLVFLTGRRGR